MFAVQADGRERDARSRGSAKDAEHLHPVQIGFWEEHGLQCGYCTPGMIMTTSALLAENPSPSEAEIRHAIEGNICRCTGYQQIVNAVQHAARIGKGATLMPVRARLRRRAHQAARGSAPDPRPRELHRRPEAPRHAARRLRAQRLRGGEDREDRRVARAARARASWPCSPTTTCAARSGRTPCIARSGPAERRASTRCSPTASCATSASRSRWWSREDRYVARDAALDVEVEIDAAAGGGRPEARARAGRAARLRSSSDQHRAGTSRASRTPRSRSCSPRPTAW